MPKSNSRAGKAALRAAAAAAMNVSKPSALIGLARDAFSAVNATASRLGEHAASFEVRLFNPSTVDRLQPSLTRYHE